MSGDRSALITVTASAGITTGDFGDVQNLVDGNTANGAGSAWAPPFGAGNEVSVVGEGFIFDMGIDVALGGAALAAGGGNVSNGIWGWEGSTSANGIGGPYTDLAADADWNTSTGSWDYSTNSNEYRYYRFKGVSGQTHANAPWQPEFDFVAGQPQMMQGTWQLFVQVHLSQAITARRK